MKTESSSELSKRIVIVGGGGVGGVGKTLVASAIADLYRRNQTPSVLFDAEREKKGGGTLSHYYAGATPLDIDSEDALDDAGRAAMNKEVRLSLVDLGAATGVVTLPWINRVAKRMASKNAKITLVSCITSNPATATAHITWANELSHLVEYLVVLNSINNDPPTFETSGAGMAFIRKFDPGIIRLPKMSSNLLNMLEKLKLTIGQAVDLYRDGDPNGQLGSKLNDDFRMSHLEEYDAAITDALESVHHLLLP